MRQNTFHIRQTNSFDLSQWSAPAGVPPLRRGQSNIGGNVMKQIGLRKFAIATSTLAFAALFSVGWSEQGGLSLSVDTAQAQPRRLYVSPRYYPNPYDPTITGLSWYAVRAYYAGGPWCGVGTGVGYGTAGAWGGSWTCYTGWDDYAQRNGIGCTPGTLVKGGDGIMYACQ
jgi:hypothetical protein